MFPSVAVLTNLLNPVNVSKSIVVALSSDNLNVSDCVSFGANLTLTF